ncbi:hypothetical protein AOE01nite_35620 [Acetobacter oeni]|uniref:Uncharacterized protein n=1 Tax=Acetobacter oeni TaxID=304077 RepID=A0A511XQU1_9PROT|nr:hypothetical protein AOE01nite_35620 [Acetobacter oeni]
MFGRSDTGSERYPMIPSRQSERVSWIVATGLDMNQSVIWVGVSIQHVGVSHQDRSVTLIEIRATGKIKSQKLGIINRTNSYSEW